MLFIEIIVLGYDPDVHGQDRRTVPEGLRRDTILLGDLCSVIAPYELDDWLSPGLMG